MVSGTCVALQSSAELRPCAGAVPPSFLYSYVDMHLPGVAVLDSWVKLLCEALDCDIGEVWYLGPPPTAAAAKAGAAAATSPAPMLIPRIAGVLSRERPTVTSPPPTADGAPHCRQRALLEASRGPFDSVWDRVHEARVPVCAGGGVSVVSGFFPVPVKDFYFFPPMGAVPWSLRGVHQLLAVSVCDPVLDMNHRVVWLCRRGSLWATAVTCSSP